MDRAVLKRQLTIDEAMGRSRLVTRDVEVEKEEQIMEIVDVAERASSPELGSPVVEVMRKVREAMKSR